MCWAYLNLCAQVMAALPCAHKYPCVLVCWWHLSLYVHVFIYHCGSWCLFAYRAYLHKSTCVSVCLWLSACARASTYTHGELGRACTTIPHLALTCCLWGGSGTHVNPHGVSYMCLRLGKLAETRQTPASLQQGRQAGALLGAWLGLFSATEEALQHLINSTPYVNTSKHRVPKAEAYPALHPPPLQLPLLWEITAVTTYVPEHPPSQSCPLCHCHLPRICSPSLFLTLSSLPYGFFLRSGLTYLA